MIDLTHSVSLALDRLVCCYCFFITYTCSLTMRLCNSRLPEEHFVCYQTSQHNWVIIKVLYRCLQRYLLGWRISRLGFVTPIVGEVSLGPLGNAHHISIPSSISLPASLFTRSVTHHPATNSLVTMLARLIVMCITEWAQRYLSDNRSDKS